MVRAFLGLILALLTATFAAAQDLDPFERANADANLNGGRPFARLTAKGAWGDPADDFAFFYNTSPRAQGAAGSPDFAIRRARRTEAEPHWATTQDCPALMSIVADLEALPLPKIDVWGIGEDLRNGPSTDGVSYALTVQWPQWPNSLGYQLSISSNLGSPLATWAGRLYDNELAACWRTGPPQRPATP